MGQTLRLEIFEIAEFPDSPTLMMPDQIEDIRLNAYERGYLAGWQDCGAQAETEATMRRALIERQIEKLDFTYHDARGHVLTALRPLLTAVAEAVLPAAARASIVPVLIEALMPIAQAAAEAPLMLRLPPGQQAAFEEATAGLVLPPLTIIESGDLAEGQADFVLGASETRVDLAFASELVVRAIEKFYAIHSQEIQRA